MLAQLAHLGGSQIDKKAFVVNFNPVMRLVAGLNRCRITLRNYHNSITRLCN